MARLAVWPPADVGGRAGVLRRVRSSSRRPPRIRSVCELRGSASRTATTARCTSQRCDSRPRAPHFACLAPGFSSLGAGSPLPRPKLLIDVGPVLSRPAFTNQQYFRVGSGGPTKLLLPDTSSHDVVGLMPAQNESEVCAGVLTPTVVVGVSLTVQWGRVNAGMISVENRRTLCLVDSPP